MSGNNSHSIVLLFISGYFVNVHYYTDSVASNTLNRLILMLKQIFLSLLNSYNCSFTRQVVVGEISTLRFAAGWMKPRFKAAGKELYEDFTVKDAMNASD